MKKAIVIGAGFSGLAAAAHLAKDGAEVTILEKNPQIGGRARMFEEKGFRFDMGPSWYWMPDVFENFFNQFGKTTSNFYELERLTPSYKVHFKDETVDIPSSVPELKSLFESYEKGAAKKLEKFLKESKYKYDISMTDLVYKPGKSLTEFIDWRVFKGFFNLNLFSSFRKYTTRYFKHPKILQLLEFPILFLGATAETTPALYSMMNYADMQLGTWYPHGGMSKIVDAFESIAQEQGVKIITDAEVQNVIIKGKSITEVITTQGNFKAEVVINSSDYHFFEQNILPENKRLYSQKYWDSRKLAPSSLIFYLGVDKKIDGLTHHNLFFDADFPLHAKEIYDTPQWPSNPLFYVCSPSKTDSSVAPEGMENIFILIPVATGLEDNENIREKYLDLVLERLESKTGCSIKEHILYKRTFAHRDFVKDYNSFKGNAYGLANTLLQTAILKPKLRNSKLTNLFNAGQLTVPGPGVPPAIISGKIAANEALKLLNT